MKKKNLSPKSRGRLREFGKKKRPRNRNKSAEQRASSDNIFPPGRHGVTWMELVPRLREGGGLHALLPGQKPSEAELRKITEAYQRQIRKSPLFKQWIKQYGKKKAVEMLKECRFEVR